MLKLLVCFEMAAQDRLLAYHVIAHPGQEPLFKKGTIPQVRPALAITDPEPVLGGFRR